MFIIDALGEKLARHLEDPVKTQVCERRAVLTNRAEVDGETAMASLSRTEARHQAIQVARANLGRVEAALREGAATESDLKAAQEKLNAERALTEKVQAEVATIHQQSHNSKAVLDRVSSYLNGIVSAAHESWDELNIYRPPIPAGDLPMVVSSQRAEIERLRREDDDLDHAVEPFECVERRLPKLVAELAERGAPQLVGAGEPGRRLSVRGPKVDIGAEPKRTGTGLIPRADDALAMLAWLAPEKILEKLTADLREAYESVELQLDPHERQRRKRELKAQILSAERIECEAIWQLIEQGNETIRFRPETSPRAILGIA